MAFALPWHESYETRGTSRAMLNRENQPLIGKGKCGWSFSAQRARLALTCWACCRRACAAASRNGLRRPTADELPPAKPARL